VAVAATAGKLNDGVGCWQATNSRTSLSRTADTYLFHFMDCGWCASCGNLPLTDWMIGECRRGNSHTVYGYGGGCDSGRVTRTMGGG